MINEELNTKLYKKLFEEQEKYRGWLFSQPPEEIFNHTYEYTMREDILLAVEYENFSDKQCRALLKSPCPLADVCTDMLVPQDHLLRKIEAVVNFERIYELVEDLYCEDNGRPSADPVVLFKMVLIQYLYGIRSLRQTVKDIELNVGYRWFLEYTMSRSRCRTLPRPAMRFGIVLAKKSIEGIFRWILEEVAKAGYLSPEVVARLPVMVNGLL